MSNAGDAPARGSLQVCRAADCLISIRAPALCLLEVPPSPCTRQPPRRTQLAQCELDHALDIRPAFDVADQRLVVNAIDQPLGHQLMRKPLNNDALD